MNNRGNLMINFFFFIMAIGMLVAFIPPLYSFVGMAQSSTFLNCQGYIDPTATVGGRNLSFNTTLNGGGSGSPLACIAIQLYLPYILAVVLVAGVVGLLSNRTENFFTGGNSVTMG